MHSFEFVWEEGVLPARNGVGFHNFVYRVSTQILHRRVMFRLGGQVRKQ